VQVYSVTNLFNETVRKCFFMAAALIFGVTTIHAQSSTNPTVYARLLTAYLYLPTIKISLFSVYII
jgi:hypothetical protein